MQRKNRLTGGKRFSQIHEQGGNAANRLLVIRFLANDSGCSRFGFLVNKRIGNAVVRNRVKRRLREAVRLSQVKPGWDALFIVRRGAGTAKYQELKDATDNLLRRADLVERFPKPIGVSPSGSLSSESPSTGSPSAGSLSAADKPNSPPSN